MGWPKVATAKNSPSSCEYCRHWLAENRPPAPSFRMPINPIEVASEEQRKYLCAWQKKCHAAGLVGSDYPTEYGGHGHKGFQTIASQEMARANVPFVINVIGLGMAAPTILMHGTEAQKRRYLPPLLSSDEIWCQGFSEPGAGSDLANVQSTAVRQGDNGIINGHKVWTSSRALRELDGSVARSLRAMAATPPGRPDITCACGTMAASSTTRSYPQAPNGAHSAHPDHSSTSTPLPMAMFVRAGCVAYQVEHDDRRRLRELLDTLIDRACVRRAASARLHPAPRRRALPRFSLTDRGCAVAV
jgi:hypothetical protein